MKRFIYILVFTLFIFINISGAKEKHSYTISGTVADKTTKQALIGASVRIEGAALGAVTDKEGKFLLRHIPRGEYNILVSFMGYKPEKIFVSTKDFTSGDTIPIKIALIQSAFKTSEIVVSANKQVQAVQDVPISLSIIDKNDILQRNVVQFDEILKYVPGLQVQNQNISIRGSSGFAFGLGSRVTLLLDGIPMLSGDNGDIKFDVIPANEISRIEVLKGAGSALYGTGAIGGIVNVISKEPRKKPTITLRAYSGIYTKPTYRQWQYRESLPFKSGAIASYSQSFGDFGTMLSAQYLRDESFHDYGDETNYNIFGKLKYKIKESGSITVLGNYANSYSSDWVYWESLDSATRPPTETDKSIMIRSDKLMFSTDGQYMFSPNFFSSIKIGYLRTSFANTYPEGNADYRQSTANALNSDIQFNSAASVHTMLTYGLTYNYNTVTSVTYGDHNQTISAFYVQTELTHIRNLITTIGLRIDNENTEGSSSNTMLSPKLGFNYALTDNTRLRLSGGRGFRAPTIAEKFASLKFQGFEVVPNLDLKPEKSWSAEIGTAADINSKKFALHLDASLFYNYMNDLIEPTFDTTSPNVPIKFMNITKARITGIELSAKTILFGFLGFNTAITLMDPRDLSLDEILKYRSKFLWYNHIALPFKYIELQADYRYLSKVVNVDPTLGLQIKNYDARIPAHILDARLLIKLYDFSDIPLLISLNAKNLLNYYYTEIPGNLGATRYLSLMIEGKF